MFSISTLIARHAREWAAGERQNSLSASGAILRHIEKIDTLRVPQRRAIEAYLWLKLQGNNRCLADLVADGALLDPGLAREHDCSDNGDIYQPLQQFLLIFAGENALPDMKRSVRRDLAMQKFDWQSELRSMLHDFDYPNHLYSLPMGAGKTYLMAAFIAIDLHFSRLLPDDRRFAHNFIVFAPHAAKTAILPSLKTIREFDPGWVLPSAAAEETRRELRVEVLDSPRAARRDTRVNNPNLEKVNRLLQSRQRGLVFITNAEKVVLEQLSEHDASHASMGVKERERLEKTNALRARMAKIPNLAVFLDEVHHAYQSAHNRQEKKLRRAISVLGADDNLIGVIGFSGTPFVKSRVDIGGNSLRLETLQDVVYDFPLARGIGTFLKTPQVVCREDVQEAAFVCAALDDFFDAYDTTYDDDTQSKIAFYCPSIKVLNEEILPVVKQWYAEHRAGKEGEIFAYYAASGNAYRDYPLPREALAEFHNLDTSHSGRRVVLLVAVGKEGWDCRSLAAVALPRRATTRNFVLQAACRCLREVHDAAKERALVYLGDGNYQIFADQLRENHDLSVDEFQNNDHSHTAPVLVRKPRLGKVRYQQVHSRLEIEDASAAADATKELARFLRHGFKKFKAQQNYYAVVREGEITSKGEIAETVHRAAVAVGDPDDFPVASFWDFLVELSQALWGNIPAAELATRHGAALKKVHRRFLREQDWFLGHPQGGDKVCRTALTAVAACFAKERSYRRHTITEQTKIELLE